MAATHVHWTFPKRYFLRIEWLTLAILLIVVFALTLLSYGKSSYALIAAAIFTALYVIISLLVQLVRQVKEKYHLSSTHLEIHRQTRYSHESELIPLKHIKRHKLDHFFHGGYVVTKKGKKHLLFFNNTKEVEKAHQHLLKHVKGSK